jgi:hypothetical protein
MIGKTDDKIYLINEKDIMKDQSDNNIHICLPIYINKLHWMFAKRYIKPISGMIKYSYPFVNDNRYWDVYYYIYSDYYKLILNCKKRGNNLSEKEFAIFISYHKTVNEIGKMNKLYPQSIIDKHTYRKYKSFNYNLLLSQIIIHYHTIDPTDLADIFYYYLKSQSYNYWKYEFDTEIVEYMISHEAKDDYAKDTMVINTINNITLNVIWHEIVAELNKYNSFNNSIMNKEQFHSIYNSVKEKTEKLKASKDMDLYNFVNKFIQKLNKDYDASHILYLSGLEDMLQTNKIKYNKTKLWSELTLEIES